MQGFNLTTQKGTTMFLLLVFIVGLFAAVGMATDSGHWLVNKTRLQNAMDAAALSAAIALHNDLNRDTANATAKGKETFDLFKQTAGNGEMAGVTSDSLTFEFSRTLNPFVPNTTPPAFVRVSTNALAISPIYIQVLSAFTDPINVYSVSTAGGVGQNCKVTPFVMCADMPPYDPAKGAAYCLDENNSSDPYCQPLDGDCNDGQCFGYVSGEIQSLVVACNGNDNGGCPENSLESGNYNLLDLDELQGGKDIREAIEDSEAVDTDFCATNVLNTKPGYTWGNVRAGIDNRFDSDGCTTEYKDSNWSPYDSPYAAYQNCPDKNERRSMATLFGDCRGLQNGNSDLPKVGVACVFLTEHAVSNGSEKKIMAEFVTSCPQLANLNPINPVFNGPFKIVLFKTDGSNDS